MTMLLPASNDREADWTTDGNATPPGEANRSRASAERVGRGRAHKVVREAVVILIETVLMLLLFAALGIPHAQERSPLEAATVSSEEPFHFEETRGSETGYDRSTLPFVRAAP